MADKGTLWPLMATVTLSAISVGADYLLKRASELPAPFRTAEFFIAALTYALMTAGWIYVLQHLKLSSVGAIYSVVIVILLALLGVTVFNETLNTLEWIGIGCAIASLILLGRFLAP